MSPSLSAMPPIEPSSDIREAVVQIRGLFNAYVEVGFSEEQAMDLVKEHLRSVLGPH